MRRVHQVGTDAGLMDAGPGAAPPALAPAAPRSRQGMCGEATRPFGLMLLILPNGPGRLSPAAPPPPSAEDDSGRPPYLSY